MTEARDALWILVREPSSEALDGLAGLDLAAADEIGHVEAELQRLGRRAGADRRRGLQLGRRLFEQALEPLQRRRHAGAAQKPRHRDAVRDQRAIDVM